MHPLLRLPLALMIALGAIPGAHAQAKGRKHGRHAAAQQKRPPVHPACHGLGIALNPFHSRLP